MEEEQLYAYCSHKCAAQVVAVQNNILLSPPELATDIGKTMITVLTLI